MNVFAPAAAGLAVLLAAFAALFFVARRIGNFGIVDVAWSGAFGALAAFYAWVGAGWPLRRIVFAAMIGVWSLRLGTHLAVRVLGHLAQEDRRYRELRVRWRDGLDVRMAVFFLLQAVSVVALGLGFLPVFAHAAPAFHPLEFAGLGLWAIAVGGEALADAQLAAFKRDPARAGRVCDAGLWRFSRHPNYFFEWLAWVAYFVFALAAPWGAIAIIGPAGILWLLLRVTGIPMTEEQSLLRRGDAYRRYQQTTSAFLPWPPKRPAADGTR
jgi:steroid 5-alpha reductase family enzyme